MNRWKRLLVAGVLALAGAGAAVAGLGFYWRLIGGGAMSVHGWIAMGLGVLGAGGLAWLLMALAFRSDREGWDDRVENSLDPARHDDEDRS